jgi:hypothetical protein
MTNPELVKDRTESTIEPTDEALERLINDKIYLLGHGTVEQKSAEGALKDGLQTRHTDLFSTANGLSTLADDPNAFEENKTAIEHWPHLDAKYVVTIGIERLEGDHIPHRRYLQSILQPKARGEDKAYEARSVIDRRFIAGYFDATNNTFVNNPSFDPHYDPALLETTVDEVIRRELDFDPNENPLEKLMGGAAVVRSQPAEKPAHSNPHDDIPDIW